jgi:MerR family copper efflux transcriptional regulator
MTGTGDLSFPVGIGKLSAASGCSPETIRYYERQGLLPEARRTPGGHRQYDEEQYKLLTFILRARQLGFGQPDVRRLLRMADPGRTECGVVHDLASRQLDTVQKRIRHLKRLERTLRQLVEDCETLGEARACPLIESLLDEPWPEPPAEA